MILRSEKMNRVLKRMLIVFFAFAMTVPVFGAAEVICSDWARTSVEGAAEKGYVPEDLLLKANSVATREELCRLIIKFYSAYSGAEVKAEGNSPFTDIDSSEVTAAVELGLFSGVSDTEFDPNGEVTKEQMATVMDRLFRKISVPMEELSGSEERFADDADISTWAWESVGRLKKNGILSGYEGLFMPKDKTTVEQAIVVIMQALPKDEAKQVTKSGADPVRVGGVSLSLDETTSQLKAKLGEPDRIDKNRFGFDRYVYNSDYTKFFMVGVKDGRVAEIYTNAGNFAFGKISSATTYDSMNFRDFRTYSSEKAVYEASGYSYSVFFDSMAGNKVDAIYIVKGGLVEADDFYSKASETYVEMELVDIINAARAKHGMAPYTRNNYSDVVAKSHSAEMQRSLRGGYNSANGLTPFQRMSNAGIDYTLASENICTNISGDAIEIYGWWMSNVSTRSNLMSENFTSIGIGAVAASARSVFFTTADMFTRS